MLNIFQFCISRSVLWLPISVKSLLVVRTASEKIINKKDESIRKDL